MTTVDPTAGGTDPSAATNSSAAIAQANAAAQQNATTQFTLNQGIKSMAQLQQVAPQVANAMKEAICTNILTEMQQQYGENETDRSAGSARCYGQLRFYKKDKKRHKGRSFSSFMSFLSFGSLVLSFSLCPLFFYL